MPVWRSFKIVSSSPQWGNEKSEIDYALGDILGHVLFAESAPTTKGGTLGEQEEGRRSLRRQTSLGLTICVMRSDDEDEVLAPSNS